MLNSDLLPRTPEKYGILSLCLNQLTNKIHAGDNRKFTFDIDVLNMNLISPLKLIIINPATIHISSWKILPYF